MDFLNFDSVETIPGFEARAAFTVSSASVFKEDVDIVPTILSDRLSYVPWGGDNQMPFDILSTKLRLVPVSLAMDLLPIRGFSILARSARHLFRIVQEIFLFISLLRIAFGR